MCRRLEMDAPLDRTMQKKSTHCGRHRNMSNVAPMPVKALEVSSKFNPRAHTVRSHAPREHDHGDHARPCGYGRVQSRIL